MVRTVQQPPGTPVHESGSNPPPRTQNPGTSDSFSTGGSSSIVNNMPGNTPNDATAMSPVDNSTMQVITNNLPGADTPLMGLITPTPENAVLFGQPINNPMDLAAQITPGSTPAYTAALIELAIKDPSALMGMLTPGANNTYNVTLHVEQPPESGQFKQVQVQVTDTLFGSPKTDGNGNTILWSALMDKAYAKLGGMWIDGQPVRLQDPLTTLTGRQVTTLDATVDTQTLWQTLSLANAPLEVPVTAFAGAGAEAHGLQSGENYSVLNTFLSAEGEQMVALVHAGAEFDHEGVQNVPLQSFAKAMASAQVADGKPAMKLENADQAQGTIGLGGCCQAGGISTQPQRERIDTPARLTENRCLLCPFARGLCVPGGVSQEP